MEKSKGMNKFCTNCGKSLPQSAKFCPYCAEPIQPLIVQENQNDRNSPAPISFQIGLTEMRPPSTLSWALVPLDPTEINQKGIYHLIGDKIILGRDNKETNQNFLDFSNFKDAETISRRHAQLTLREGTWHLTDNQSANGTYYNHQNHPNAFQQITGTVPLQNGDAISLGLVRLLLRSSNE